MLPLQWGKAKLQKFKIPKNPDWQKVSFDIKDVVRHELEHLTQDGDNVKGGTDSDDPKLVRPSKQMDDDQLLRDLIDADLLNNFVIHQAKLANLVYTIFQRV